MHHIFTSPEADFLAPTAKHKMSVHTALQPISLSHPLSAHPVGRPAYHQPTQDAFGDNTQKPKRKRPVYARSTDEWIQQHCMINLDFHLLLLNTMSYNPRISRGQNRSNVSHLTKKHCSVASQHIEQTLLILTTMLSWS